MKTKSELIDQLARKYNIPQHEVTKAVEYQFKYTAGIIRKGNFEAVRLPYFGVFRVHPGRVKHLNKKKQHKKQQNEK